MNYLNEHIKNICKIYDNKYEPKTLNIELITNISELFDKLIIVNIKLYNLKNKVMQNKNDVEFCAHSAIIDVELCKQRSMLKNAIDEKVIAIIHGNTGVNKEPKSYE